MTESEKAVLQDVVQVLENLTVGLDAIEGALIHANLLTNGQRQQLEPDYRQAAMKDLTLLRLKIASL